MRLIVVAVQLFAWAALFSAGPAAAVRSAADEEPAAVSPGASAGVHLFNGVASLECETCQFMMLTLMTSHGRKLGDLCELMKEDHGLAPSVDEADRLAFAGGKIPLDIACRTFMLRQKDKIGGYLEPLSLCKAMNRCPASAKATQASVISVGGAASSVATSAASSSASPSVTVTAGGKVNCIVSDYGVFGACSKPCGGGEMVRTRTIKAQPINGGLACPALEEKAVCNTQQCGNPGVVGCADSSRDGLRQTTAFKDMAVCGPKRNYPDAVTAASKTCAAGWHMCTPEDLLATRTTAAPVGEANVPAWIKYDAAASDNWLYSSHTSDVSCVGKASSVAVLGQGSGCAAAGSGGWRLALSAGAWAHSHKVKDGKCVPHVDHVCGYPGGSVPVAAADTACCRTVPKADCKVSEWSAYAACTKPCGGGSKTRKRTVTQAAAGGGAECPALEETVACNAGACKLDPALAGCSNSMRVGIKDHVKFPKISECGTKVNYATAVATAANVCAAGWRICNPADVRRVAPAGTPKPADVAGSWISYVWPGQTAMYGWFANSQSCAGAQTTAANLGFEGGCTPAGRAPEGWRLALAAGTWNGGHTSGMGCVPHAYHAPAGAGGPVAPYTLYTACCKA